MMGWRPDEALYMDVTDIEAACKGRWDMINKVMSAIFGEAEPEKPIAASGANFAAMMAINGATVVNV